MTIICSPGPFPSYSSIRNSVDGLFQSIQNRATTSIENAIAQAQAFQPPITVSPPDINITLPPMPGMPQITWPFTSSLGLELEMFANQLQSFQQLSIMSAAYQVLSSFVSLPLPSIPGIPGATLDTLLQLNPSALLTNLSPIDIPGLYQDLEWPDMETLSTLQIRIGEYQSIMITFLFNLVNEVVNKIPGDVPSLAPLPVIPSAQEIFNLIPGRLSFPGFAIDLSIPDPLIPDFDFPEYEKGQVLKMIMNSLPTASLKTIVDFITNTLGLSLPLELLCLPVNFS